MDVAASYGVGQVANMGTRSITPEARITVGDPGHLMGSARASSAFILPSFRGGDVGVQGSLLVALARRWPNLGLDLGGGVSGGRLTGCRGTPLLCANVWEIAPTAGLAIDVYAPTGWRRWRMLGVRVQVEGSAFIGDSLLGGAWAGSAKLGPVIRFGR